MPKQNSNTTSTALQQLEKAEFLMTSTTNAMGEVDGRVTELHGRLVPGNPAGSPPLDPPEGAEGEEVEWRTVQQKNVNLLNGSAGNVREKDQGYRLARAKAAAMSAQRESRLNNLGSHYSDLKRLAEATYGLEHLHVLGLDGRRAGARLAQREQLKEVGERMNDPEQLAQLPAPRGGMAALDFASLSAVIQQMVADFEAYLEEIKDLRKTIKKLAFERREAIALHRRVYANVGRIQEGLFRLAGLDDLAAQIRAKLPRSSGKSSSDEPSDADSSAPGSEAVPSAVTPSAV